jgi:IS5 family transposase
LAEVNRRLDARGLIIKRGTLVDATIIAAAVKPPPIEEGQVNPRDPEASFTKKNDETYFGYKAHLAVDEESGLVRRAEMTSADLHDSQRGEALIQGDEQAYYADKAYDSQALRDKLNELGIEDKIAYKAKRNKPLVNWQVWFNKTASSIRVGVERANATLKNWYGMEKVRYLGLDRNNCHLQFVAMAMNMKRARVLVAAA